MLAAAWKVLTPLAALAGHHCFVGDKQKWCTSNFPKILSQVINFYNNWSPHVKEICSGSRAKLLHENKV